MRPRPSLWPEPAFVESTARLYMGSVASVALLAAPGLVPLDARLCLGIVNIHSSMIRR